MTMTKEEALAEMQKGKKLTHTSFTEDEWMSLDDKTGDMVLEDGVICSPYEFWRYRQGPEWEKDYEIFKDGL